MAFDCYYGEPFLHDMLTGRDQGFDFSTTQDNFVQETQNVLDVYSPAGPFGPAPLQQPQMNNVSNDPGYGEDFSPFAYEPIFDSADFLLTDGPGDCRLGDGATCLQSERTHLPARRIPPQHHLHNGTEMSYPPPVSMPAYHRSPPVAAAALQPPAIGRSTSRVVKRRPRQRSGVPTRGRQTSHASIGTVLINGDTGEVLYKCDAPECFNQTFARLQDLRRHFDGRHEAPDKKTQAWCPVPGCDRHRTGSGGPFPRKDKMVDHLSRVHRDVVGL